MQCRSGCNVASSGAGASEDGAHAELQSEEAPESQHPSVAVPAEQSTPASRSLDSHATDKNPGTEDGDVVSIAASSVSSSSAVCHAAASARRRDTGRLRRRQRRGTGMQLQLQPACRQQGKRRRPRMRCWACHLPLPRGRTGGWPLRFTRTRHVNVKHFHKLTATAHTLSSNYLTRDAAAL